MSASNIHRLSSEDLRVQWPYKYLWNVLRGESVVADDEVILEELRIAYEKIILALTQYPTVEGKEGSSSRSSLPTPTITAGNDKSVPTTTTGPSGSAWDGGAGAASTSATAGEPPTPTSRTRTASENAGKLKSRIAEYLELEENAAWDVFQGFMMFEYRGGITSFEKLLETPIVSTEFLRDVKQYYHHERVSVLLVIQAIFGCATQADHKYNRIFEAVCDWVKEQNGATTLVKNLLKSLELARNDHEEVQVLHALAIFIYLMPVESVEVFCNTFSSFKPGRKDRKIVLAEAALISVLVNFCILQETNEEIPEPLHRCIEKFLEANGDDLLLNDYNTGSVLSGCFASGFGNVALKRIIAHPKHRFEETFGNMLALTMAYSETNVENRRNNLPPVILKSIFFTLRTLAERFKEDRLFRCGTKDEFFKLSGQLLESSEVAALLCSDEGSVLHQSVCSAMMEFPIKLKHILHIFGGLCSANAKIPDQCIPVLKNCCQMVTTLAECLKDHDKINEILELLHGNRNKLREPRVVAGVELPVGTELEKMEEVANNLILYWRIPDSVTVDVFNAIYHEVLIPVVTQYQSVALTAGKAERAVRWVQEENSNIWNLIKFLIKYASFAPTIIDSLYQLYQPTTFVIRRSIDLTGDWKLRMSLCSYLVDLLIGSSRFGFQSWSHAYFLDMWPQQSDTTTLISDIIMGYESVANTECKVSIAFLKSTLSFVKKGDGTVSFGNDVIQRVAFNSVDFINENLFHSFTRWRFSEPGVKYEILLNCLKVYGCVFDVELETWKEIKTACAQTLLVANSSLMTVLSSAEDSLQLSVVQPSKENHLLPEVIYECLSVLLKLFQFQTNAIKLVDETLGSTLVQKLGRFSRHRLDYKIPSLAMAILKKIAEVADMSLLSCFGSEEMAFRDLISQRLEYKSEDVNLKVSILDFLTVAAHTQPGLIQFIFMDEVLAQTIVDLPIERDEGLTLSALCFLRALFRKGTAVLKKSQNLWENVFHPINQLQQDGRLKIITCTLNIASMELYRFGLANSKFATEVKSLMKDENFIHLLEMPLSQSGEECLKCLSAFKHFNSVILHRNDLEDFLSDNARKAAIDMLTRYYWVKREEEKYDTTSCKVVMDLLCQLTNCITDSDYSGKYLDDFCSRLSNYFMEDTVSVQLSSLAITNICMKKTTAEYLTPSVLENILRLVARVFDNTAKIFSSPAEILDQIGGLLTLSTSIVNTIIKKVNVREWKLMFHRYAIPHAVVHSAHIGLDKSRCEGLVLQLLHLMVNMADIKECAEALVSANILQKIFLCVVRNLESLPVDLTSDSKMIKIYFVTLHLMTRILRTEKIYFIEHSFTLWGNHGSYIINQINSLPAMTSDCNLTHGDYNFRMMKNRVTYCVYALDAIRSMIVFWKHWNRPEQMKLMDSVYTAMQTSVNLLDQPQYLQSFFAPSRLKGSSSTEVKTTPQLLELNSKLWDVIHISSFIFWTLRVWVDSVAGGEKTLCISNQIAQTCLKFLSKPERRRHTSSSSGTQSGNSHPHPHIHIEASESQRIMDSLERVVSMYLFHSEKVLESPNLPQKQKQTMLREISGDSIILCDGIKRVVAVHPSVLLTKLRESLETQCKTK